jgi:hypothetical protein
MNRTSLAIALAAAMAGALVTLASACGGEESSDPAKRKDAAAEGTVLLDGQIVLPDGAIVFPDDAAAIDQYVPPPIDAGYGWDNADAYVANLGPSARSDAGHNFVGNVPRSNPVKQQCLNCHKDGGAAGDVLFFAAGSIKYSADGGPAPMAEVRLKAYTNFNAISTYTDNDGNWYITREMAADAGVGFAVRPGVRNATITRQMGSSPAIGNCNQCHGSQISL